MLTSETSLLVDLPSVPQDVDQRSVFERNWAEHQLVFGLVAGLRDVVEETGLVLADCLARGGKILLCGNGGSAADCQHIAAELTGRFLNDRAPLAALALTTDTSALTCIANDYQFAEVFARQVKALGRPGDCLVGISTSGNSKNVVMAASAAIDLGISTIALTGQGGVLSHLCDHAVAVPSGVTARVQEAHIFIGHTWCGLIEQSLASRGLLIQ
ncbi:MAG: SIS domain-containing protein [Rubrivivax sp.]|nr:MAG: SIS domain-containing protein [Rubrivivax sp.]